MAILMGHMAGNLKSRFTDFLTTDGDKPWRERDQEFEDHAYDRTQLLASWNEGWKILFETLEQLTEEDLGKDSVKLEVDGMEVLLVDLDGPQNRLVVAMVPREGETWFVKMMGSKEVLELHKPALESFVKSIRFSES